MNSHLCCKQGWISKKDARRMNQKADNERERPIKLGIDLEWKFRKEGKTNEMESRLFRFDFLAVDACQYLIESGGISMTWWRVIFHLCVVVKTHRICQAFFVFRIEIISFSPPNWLYFILLRKKLN